MKYALVLSLAAIGCAGAETVTITPAQPVTPPAEVTVEARPAAQPSAAPVASAAPAPSAAPQAPAKPRPPAQPQDGAEFGMIGLLGTGDPNVVKGNMWGADIGDSFGVGGLGLAGAGGGGKGDGIGLGSIGGLGHGAGTGQGYGLGSGRLGGSNRTKPPHIKMGATTVSGRLPPEVIQRIVRQNFGRFRLCYENGLRNNPKLEGKVTVRFEIGRDGAVSTVGDGGSTMPDKGVTSCVTRAFYGLSFPQPEGGKVIVTYPIHFSPPGDSTPAPPPPAQPPMPTRSEAKPEETQKR